MALLLPVLADNGEAVGAEVRGVCHNGDTEAESGSDDEPVAGVAVDVW